MGDTLEGAISKLRAPRRHLLLCSTAHGCCPGWSDGRRAAGATCLRSRVRPSAAPRTAACQAPLSMGSPGKDTGAGCRFPLQGIFPSRDEPASHVSSIGRQVLYHCATWKALQKCRDLKCNFKVGSPRLVDRLWNWGEETHKRQVVGNSESVGLFSQMGTVGRSLPPTRCSQALPYRIPQPVSCREKIWF